MVKRKSSKNPPPLDALEVIEAMIDQTSTRRVVLLIAEVCELKAQHIRENWQDDVLAKVWERDAKRLVTVAQKIMGV